MRQIFPPHPASTGAASPATTSAGRERLAMLIDELNRPLNSQSPAGSSSRGLRGYFASRSGPWDEETPELACARAAARAALGCDAGSDARREADALLAASMKIHIDA